MKDQRPIGNAVERFQRIQEATRLAQATGAIDNPRTLALLQAAASPLRHGGVAAKALGSLERSLQGAALRLQLRQQAAAAWPEVDPREGICLGIQAANGRPCRVPLADLSMHCLLNGPTGTGKTNAVFFLLLQLVAQGTAIRFIDYKNEGRRLLTFFPRALVLNPDQLRINLLAPVGEPRLYYTEFLALLAWLFNLRRETSAKLLAIMLRLIAGLAPDEPPPSLHDFRLVLQRLAPRRRDASLETAAAAIGTLCAVLGRAAKVRSGPELDDYPVIVYQRLGLARNVAQFLSSVWLLRHQLRQTAAGHARGLRQVYVLDEAGIEYYQGCSTMGGAIVPPQVRLITQARSSGTGVIAGVQSLADVDPVLPANTGTIVCLGTRSPQESRHLARLLGLPEEQAEALQRLPLGTAWVRSLCCPVPVKIRIPQVEAGDYLGDDALARRMAPLMRDLDTRTVFSDLDDEDGAPISYSDLLRPEPETVTTAAAPPSATDSEESALPDADPRLFAEWRLFLEEVDGHPQRGVTAHYLALGWSAGRGNRVKDLLIDQGLLTAEREVSRQGGRPRERLVLTPAGRRFLDVTA